MLSQYTNDNGDFALVEENQEHVEIFRKIGQGLYELVVSIACEPSDISQILRSNGF